MRLPELPNLAPPLQRRAPQYHTSLPSPQPFQPDAAPARPFRPKRPPPNLRAAPRLSYTPDPCHHPDGSFHRQSTLSPARPRAPKPHAHAPNAYAR